MKITLRDIAIIIFCALIGGFSTCGIEHFKTKSEDKQNAKEAVLKTDVKVADLKNDSILAYKAIYDKIYKKVTDSTNKVVYSLQGQISGLKNRKAINDSKSSATSVADKEKFIDSSRSKDLTKTFEDIKDSGLNDSLLNFQSQLIATQKAEHLKDSTENNITNEALKACEDANTEHKKLDNFQVKAEKKHKILDFINKARFYIVAAVATVETAVIGAAKYGVK